VLSGATQCAFRVSLSTQKSWRPISGQGRLCSSARLFIHEFFVSCSQLSRSSVWVLLIGLFYAMAVLEVDPGDLGDDFGDVYDTHLSVTSEKALKVIPAFFPAPSASDQAFSFVHRLPLRLVRVVHNPYQQHLAPARRIYLHYAVWRI